MEAAQSGGCRPVNSRFVPRFLSSLPRARARKSLEWLIIGGAENVKRPGRGNWKLSRGRNNEYGLCFRPLMESKHREMRETRVTGGARARSFIRADETRI